MSKEKKLTTWLATLYPQQIASVRFAAQDADARQYYRLRLKNGQSYIAMQAQSERITPYIKVQNIFQAVCVPAIYHVNQQEGLMVLQDFGDDTFIHLMRRNPEPSFHQNLLLKAIDTLIQLQNSSQEGQLPPYQNAVLEEEMDLFVNWCFPYYFKRFALSLAEQQLWCSVKKLIIQQIAQTSQVYVHRDYIVRNLMLLHDNNVGVIDFQDALWGSICYDLVSLTKDAFFSWDESLILDVVTRYWQKAKQAGLPVDHSFDDFYRHYEWMGVQRHFKVAGIFARLKARDNKTLYFDEIPRFIGYLKQTCQRYSKLHGLYQLLLTLDKSDGT